MATLQINYKGYVIQRNYSIEDGDLGSWLIVNLSILQDDHKAKSLSECKQIIRGWVK